MSSSSGALRLHARHGGEHRDDGDGDDASLAVLLIFISGQASLVLPASLAFSGSPL